MTAELESALQERCKGDERLRLLQAQWEYDQRLVARSLQTIGNAFPHYTLHDASHSNTILVQITRVLGPESWLGSSEQVLRLGRWSACRVQAAAVRDSRSK